MKRWCLAVIALAGTSYTAFAEGIYVPIYPMGGSIAPYVDADGYVNPIISLGEIDFGRGLTLPLKINYSSTVRPPSPEFGQGWECPLFESKIFDVQQGLKKIELLGGKTIFLAFNQRTNKWKHFYSSNWTGEAKGEDFELTYASGCKFFFNKGLISSMTTPDGRTVVWNRSGDKLVSMQEVGKSPAMTMTYDQLGFAKQIILNPDKLGVSQNIFNFTPDMVSAGIGNIQGPEGRVITITRARDKALNPVLTWTDNKRVLSSTTVSWSIKTGKILTDDLYNYQFTETMPDFSFPQMLRKNKKTGKTETYYFDQKHGTTTQTLADGTVRYTEMVQAPGPNYKAVRLIKETKKGVTRTIMRRAFDDQGHLLMEAIGLANGKEQVAQYTYDQAGRVVSYLFNGKEMWKNIYDPSTGFLKERELPNLGVKMAYEQLPGGEVKESILNAAGAVSSTQKLSTTDWQQKVASMQRIQ